jgi:two-component system NarL family sensor kinase
MAGDELLTALLDRLSPSMTEAVESSTEAISALQECAAEARRFATNVQDEDVRKRLDLVAEVLPGVVVVIERSKRRWSRLALDLHDGALQEVAALRLELHAFRSRLRKAGGTGASQLDDVVAFANELDERLQSLDGSLRELVASFEPPALADVRFEVWIRKFVREFRRDSGIAVAVELSGDFSVLTRSQRIVLIRVAVEAMTNVGRHSGAERAWVTARVQKGRARLRVRDNGRGFDVRRTSPRAAKRGRRGLVGMAERVELLGGQFNASSRPGGPTTITASIPAGPVAEPAPTAGRRARTATR